MNTLSYELKTIWNVFKKNMKIYYPFIIVLFLYLIGFAIFDPHGNNCMVQRTIHIPCPMCGMTRASVYLFQLKLVDAFKLHPLVFIMPLITLTVFLNGYRIFTRLFYSKTFWSIILILFIVVYGIRMYLYFPHTEPMIPYI